MQKSYQLIELYCAICYHYDTALSAHAQRMSNNFCPKFSDEECLATLIWGIANQKYDVKRCYEFIQDYYGDWFPKLPSYQTYNKRICFLADAFRELAGILLGGLGLDSSHADFVYDSMPIVVANSARSGRAKVASELCNKGYCASKDMWYYGSKLHILAQCNYKAKPTPAQMQISKASEHDRKIAEEMLSDVYDIRLFADMALLDQQWQAKMLAENNVEILTPIKRKKGQKVLPSVDKFLSSAISSVKQAVESLNYWLIEKTNIQRASKVRSENGLTVFLFARVACACLCFNC
ncbi:MAG: hypothetical protein FWG38_10650 [Defluviitaleaceae bacterium]|nr:hypothetical protein [Defluviitaleaceae bacterium]